MALFPKKQSKSVDELIEDSKVKKQALKKIIDKVTNNTNQKKQ